MPEAEQLDLVRDDPVRHEGAPGVGAGRHPDARPDRPGEVLAMGRQRRRGTFSGAGTEEAAVADLGDRAQLLWLKGISGDSRFREPSMTWP